MTPAGADAEAAEKGETDDRGVKRFYGLAPGRYRLDARYTRALPGLGRIYEIDSIDVDLRPGENPPVHISARRAGAETFSISGVIEGIKFDGRPYRLEIRPIGANGAEGSSLFQFGPELNVSLLAKGEYILHLAPLGGARPLLLGRIRLDGNLTGLTLEPKPLPIVVGHVRFDDEAPRHARLTLRSDQGWLWRHYDVRRDAPNFTIGDAPPGRYTLTCDQEDAFLSEKVVVQLEEDSNQTIQVTVSARFATVRGGVRENKGGPVQVELSGPRGPAFVAPGHAGAFRFDKLVPGDYFLCVTRAGEGCPAQRRLPFVVEAGDDVELDVRVPE